MCRPLNLPSESGTQGLRVKGQASVPATIQEPRHALAFALGVLLAARLRRQPSSHRTQHQGAGAERPPRVPCEMSSRGRQGSPLSIKHSGALARRQPERRPAADAKRRALCRCRRPSTIIVKRLPCQPQSSTLLIASSARGRGAGHD